MTRKIKKRLISFLVFIIIIGVLFGLQYKYPGYSKEYSLVPGKDLSGDVYWSGLEQDYVIVRDGVGTRVIDQESWYLNIKSPKKLDSVSLELDVVSDGEVYANDILVYSPEWKGLDVGRIFDRPIYIIKLGKVVSI